MAGRLSLAFALLALGCLHERPGPSVARPQSDALPPRLPSAIAPKPQPQPISAGTSAPVVLLGRAEPTASPLLLEPPAIITATDERKTLREKLAEKREERIEKREEAKKLLPSPIAPKKDKDAPATPATAGEAAALYRKAIDRLNGLADFECRFVRREVVGNERREPPTEEVLFQFRAKPFSVYMRNIGEAGKGREVVYVAGKFEDKMHVVTGEGDNRLVGAGFRTSLKPDSPMATAKSRHQITEAGFASSLAKLGKAVAGNRAKALGTVTRKEYAYPLDAVEVTYAPGDDAGLPKGGKQVFYFDPKADSASYALPVVMVVTDAAGREVEYYAYDRFKVPANLTDNEFTPERLGKK